MVGLVAIAAAVLAGGCHDPTEIVVVVDSDLRIGVDFDRVDFMLFTANPNRFPPGAGLHVADGYVLPATLGLVPQQGGAQVFDIMVSARHGLGPFGPENTAVVTRRVSNIPFIPDERRAVFITLLRQCMCEGTNCDISPPCNDITAPVLTEFDEDNVPHL
jgi:hypothetical protein